MTFAMICARKNPSNTDRSKPRIRGIDYGKSDCLGQDEGIMGEVHKRAEIPEDAEHVAS
jgi:hypothetical protein